MLVVRMVGLAAVAGLGLAIGAAGGLAQDKRDVQTPAGPVGGDWAQTTNAEAGGGQMTPAQAEIVKQFTAYFNGMLTLKGNFVQTDPDSKRTRGRFSIKRPGMFRFDYGGGTKKVVISDGRLLAIQDQDLKNEDIVELDNTPFRVLLRKDVNLARDANVLDVQEAEDVLTIALQDKSPDAPGRIQLILMRKPQPQLKEWVITDAQGLRTRVELSDVVQNSPVEDALFKREIMRRDR